MEESGGGGRAVQKTQNLADILQKSKPKSEETRPFTAKNAQVGGHWVESHEKRDRIGGPQDGKYLFLLQ